MLKQKFGDLDEADWDAIVDETLTYPENLQMILRDYADYITKAQLAAGYREKELYITKQNGAEDARRAEASEGIWQEMEECTQEPWKPEDWTPDDESEHEEQREGWQVKTTSTGEVHWMEIEIEPHTVARKGKTYCYGRIQLSAASKYVGLNARVSFFVPKELL